MAHDNLEPVATVPDSSIEKAPQVQHAEHPFVMGGSKLDEEAKQATAIEHSMTVWKSIKTYRKAVFWSVIVSATIIMEGYDTTLIGSFFAYPMFKQKYGKWTGEDHGYQLSAPVSNIREANQFPLFHFCDLLSSFSHSNDHIY